MKRQFHLAKPEKGFTMLELMVTIFIITVGIGSISGLITYTLSYASFNSSKLTASYLAQEGIEIVRNIVDTNMIRIYSGEGISWNDGLGVDDWEADYTTQNLTDTYDGDFLNIDSSGFYSYSSGTQTKFKRKITISSGGADILNIIVEVSWQEKGKPYEVTAEERLYNWR